MKIIRPTYACVMTAAYYGVPVVERYILCPDGHTSRMSDDTFEKCERGARIHIAQMRYPDPLAIETIRNESDTKEFRGWVQFQERYRVLRDLGYSDAESHDIACGSPTHPKYEDAIGNPPSQPNLAGIAR